MTPKLTDNELTVYVTWTSKTSGELQRIRFEISTSGPAEYHLRNLPWSRKSHPNVRIYDLANKKCAGKQGIHSTIFISTDATIPEIVAAVRDYMAETYHADSPAVEVNLI